jgi:ABC-2 type transport system permease protein
VVTIERVPTRAMQYRALTWLQLTKVRQGWFFHLLIPSLIAIGVVWLRSLVGFTDADQAGVIRYVSGAAVLGAVFGTVNASAHDTARAKDLGEVEYLATFPVHRAALTVAIVTAPVLSSIPVVIATFFGGWWLLGTPFHVSPAVLLVVAIVAVMLASVGVALGLYLPPRLAATVANILPLSLMVLTPILFRPETLPFVLEHVGRVLPTSIAVHVVEKATFGGGLGRSELDDLFVIALAAAVVSLVVRLPGWRQR